LIVMAETNSATSSTAALATGQKVVAEEPAVQPQVVRETIESLAVAFILALLFKAFVADAFIIPTGSMAPTLMGAHKDLQCPECGFAYQSGASSEFNNTTGVPNGSVVTQTICPMCRSIDKLDKVNVPNHRTFPGDRILVSKLAYALGEPKRWQVIVFKFIEDAKTNYIKRCIGLPGESVKIWHGDVFTKKTSEPDDKYVIARKPPNILGAMLQSVADTNHVAKSIVEGQVPDAWQDASGGSNGGWTTRFDSNGTGAKVAWNASIENAPVGTPKMLRYRHRVITPDDKRLMAQQDVQALGRLKDPKQFRLITDFTAYNVNIGDNRLNENRIAPIAEFFSKYDGDHWVGDLAGEWTFSTASGTEGMRFLLVEGGIEFVCDVDLKTGVATAKAIHQGELVSLFETGKGMVNKLEAKSGLRSGSKHTVRFANVDDALHFWVDGKRVDWGDGAYDVLKAIPGYKHLPVYSADEPMDAAPLGIGVSNGSCNVQRAKVFRDIYYIATNSVRFADIPNHLMIDERSYQQVLGNQRWEEPNRLVEFELGNDDYFPMGDNTAASSDARIWAAHAQPGRLMIGRAVMVFWPHPWTWSRIPFVPNFQRMGLIR
jgi:signal peptidase I